MTNGDYNCGLKIFEKSKFWQLVVKGRERADTIVRETSVQATLTARCGHVTSFLQICGFFETSDQVVLELELLDGRDLFNHISSRERLEGTGCRTHIAGHLGMFGCHEPDWAITSRY